MDKIEKHPSFGMIRLTETHGGDSEFFGAPANSGNSCISMEISASEVDWSGSYPSYFASQKSMIRLRMTHAQFVNMVTSIGRGEGTPCTLVYTRDADGTLHDIDPPPRSQNDTDRVKEDFVKKCKRFESKLRFYTNQIDYVLEKKSITKADRELIKEAMQYIKRESGQNMPYMITMFNEAAERIVSHAKNEVDAVVNTYVKGMGLAAIKSGFDKLLENKTG